ncbi:MAG: hypothetical protein AAF208_09470 [Cyanobacteria bacterium P01_A01_bin.45]
MEEHSKENNHPVSKNFEKSLEDLGNILDKNQNQEQKQSKNLSSQEKLDHKNDLSIWEDAIADIEQYLEKRKEKPKDTENQ